MKTLRPYQQDAYNEIFEALKSGTSPVLLSASVGAGKSLICAEVLLKLEKAGCRGLCLTMNSILIEQNADTYNLQGGNAGIYCSALKKKDVSNPVIFASPHSVNIAIRNKKKIGEQRFNLIIIDECHNVDHKNEDSMYMRILNHYGFMAQQEQYKYRILGLTGTPFRGKNESIIGGGCLFKREVTPISMSWLIENGYLTQPIFNQVDKKFDFSSVKPNNMGKFNVNEMNHVVDEQRLTGDIMEDVIDAVESEDRKGAFVFCVSKRHCEEAYKALPSGEAAIICAETKATERQFILKQAQEGKIKYLVNVATLLTGIDLPLFQVACFIRPTESLGLFIQAMGRVLRLHPEKQNALVLDFAGNVDRFHDWDDPILNDALQSNKETEHEYVIPCPDCGTMNKDTTRRCIHLDINKKRCDHYFEFKECPKCQAENDIVTRYCRKCSFELIDPNSRLEPGSLKGDQSEFHVAQMSGKIISHTAESFTINIRYEGQYSGGEKGIVREYYRMNSEKIRNMFYGVFVKNHVDEPSDWYPLLTKQDSIEEMFRVVNCPSTLVVNGRQRIQKRYF